MDDQDEGEVRILDRAWELASNEDATERALLYAAAGAAIVSAWRLGRIEQLLDAQLRYGPE